MLVGPSACKHLASSHMHIMPCVAGIGVLILYGMEACAGTRHQEACHAFGHSCTRHVVHVSPAAANPG